MKIQQPTNRCYVLTTSIAAPVVFLLHPKPMRAQVVAEAEGLSLNPTSPSEWVLFIPLNIPFPDPDPSRIK